MSILIVYVGDLLSEREDNLMVYNTLMAFMGELIIILASRVGLADHPDRIMIGIVMLLISGLSTTNGIRISFRVTLYQDFTYYEFDAWRCGYCIWNRDSTADVP